MSPRADRVRHLAPVPHPGFRAPGQAMRDAHQREADEIFSQADASVTACRARGHSWPRMEAGRPLKNVRVSGSREGGYQITEVCEYCGTERTRTLLPGFRIDRNAHYVYRYPENWVHVPSESGVTKADWVDQNLRNNYEVLERMARVEADAG